MSNKKTIKQDSPMAVKDEPVNEEHTDKGVPLVTGNGTATLADGALKISYRQHSKKIKVEIAGKQVEMTKLELWQFVFSICDDDLREELLPVRKTEMMEYERLHSVELSKDMKQGEILQVKCRTNIPKMVVDAIMLEEKPTAAA